jgi:8-oxo-dGTP pyrophosphatase MutT (NUDIX family)
LRKIFSACGILLFWVLWPFWFVHFKSVPRRTRVLVLHNDEVLLVKGWLSARGGWSLPGGGIHKGESNRAGAVRELKEETGLTFVESDLQELGEHRHTRFGLHYTAIYFAVFVHEKGATKIRWPEVLELSWQHIEDARSNTIDEDAALGLTSYAVLLPNL